MHCLLGSLLCIAVEGAHGRTEEGDEDLEADMRRARLAAMPLPTSQPAQPIPTANQHSHADSTDTIAPPASSTNPPEVPNAETLEERMHTNGTQSNRYPVHNRLPSDRLFDSVLQGSHICYYPSWFADLLALHSSDLNCFTHNLSMSCSQNVMSSSQFIMA